MKLAAKTIRFRVKALKGDPTMEMRAVAEPASQARLSIHTEPAITSGFHSSAQLGHSDFLIGSKFSKHPSWPTLLPSQASQNKAFHHATVVLLEWTSGSFQGFGLWHFLGTDLYLDPGAGEMVPIERSYFLLPCADPAAQGGYHPQILNRANTLTCFSGSCESTQIQQPPTHWLAALGSHMRGPWGLNPPPWHSTYQVLKSLSQDAKHRFTELGFCLKVDSDWRKNPRQ